MPQPFRQKITPEQIKYFCTHIDFLALSKIVKKQGFSMDYYGNPPCGTAGCSAGYMPLSIGKEFGETKTAFGFIRCQSEWEWCFSSGWNNSALQAAGRMWYLLNHGLPEYFGTGGNRHCYYTEDYPPELKSWLDRVKKEWPDCNDEKLENTG